MPDSPASTRGFRPRAWHPYGTSPKCSFGPDGKLIAHVAEERLDRIKMSAGAGIPFPLSFQF